MITLKKILYNSLTTTLCHIRYATFMTSGYGRKNDFHMPRLTNQLISPLSHLGSINYPDLDTLLSIKISSTPPSSKRFGKIKKNFKTQQNPPGQIFYKTTQSKVSFFFY